MLPPPPARTRQAHFVGMEAQNALEPLMKYPCILQQLVGRTPDDGDKRAAHLLGHFADFQELRDVPRPCEFEDARPYLLDAVREECELLLCRHGASIASSSQCTCPPLEHMHVADRNYRRLLCGIVLLVNEESAPPSDQATQHARDLGIQGLEANPLSPERKRPRE